MVENRYTKAVDTIDVSLTDPELMIMLGDQSTKRMKLNLKEE